MPTAYESLVFHDAAREHLRYLVNVVASGLMQTRGWTAAVGTLPDSTGLRVPWSGRSWGELVTLAVEERSIRIISEGRSPLQTFDWGKNRANVELVRQSLRQAMSVKSSDS